MELSIILRTHDRTNLHGERYTGTGKAEVTYRCAYSLVRSVNEAISNGLVRSEKVTLTVLDDHSDRPEVIRQIVSYARCKTQFEALEGTGNNASLLRYFELGKQAKDLVYLIEDDYLHEPGALTEMLFDHAQFSKNLGRPVAINPFNDPDNYRPTHMMPSRIAQGSRRHWRTSDWTLCTLLVPSEVVRTHWSAFEKLARLYEKGFGITEGNTLSPIWNSDVVLFAPIPSLALHVQTEQQKDPYIDWKAWWEANEYRHTLSR